MFRTTVSIPGRNRAVFLLMYEELLQRRLGSYELVTSLRPLQLVSRLSMDVTIVDHAPVVDLEVLPLRSKKITGLSSTLNHIRSRDANEQTQFPSVNNPETLAPVQTHNQSIHPGVLVLIRLNHDTLPVSVVQPSPKFPSRLQSPTKTTSGRSPSAPTSSSRPRSPPAASWETS